MDVNFYGAVYCTYYALPYLIRSRGRIVAVSSLGGKAPLPYNSPYIASKFAMHGFFDSLRMELCKARGECDHHLSLLGGDRFPRGADGQGRRAQRCGWAGYLHEENDER